MIRNKFDLAAAHVFYVCKKEKKLLLLDSIKQAILGGLYYNGETSKNDVIDVWGRRSRLIPPVLEEIIKAGYVDQSYGSAVLYTINERGIEQLKEYGLLSELTERRLEEKRAELEEMF